MQAHPSTSLTYVQKNTMENVKIISKKTAERMLERNQLKLSRRITERESGFLFQMVRCPRTEERYQYLLETR